MNRRWRSDRVFALALALALALTAILHVSPVLGLYLLLDSNGDGARTGADVVNPHDTTHVTVWLITDQYIDGTSAECSHGRREGEHSYSIVFSAIGGTVAWGQFIPDPPPHGDNISYESDDSTYLKVSRNIPDWGATHQLRLGTFTVVVRRGRPSIEVVSRRPMQPYDETRIATGTWDGPFASCAYGLPYGGPANQPPSLTPLGDYTIRAGTAERLIIQATDLDKEPLAFRLKRGPSYISVSTLDPGHGVALGEIHVAPDSCDRGPAECVIEVGDGFASDSDTMLLTVNPVVRLLPTTPMQASIFTETLTARQDRAPIDSQWLAGEWEWDETSREGYLPRPGPYDGPAHRGYRRRIVFRRTGDVEMFEIGPNRVLRAQRGTYSVVQESAGARFTISNWLDNFNGDAGSFIASKEGPSSLIIYPWGVFDASRETFVRVPPVVKDGAPTDSGKVIAPIDTPSMRLDRNGSHIILPEPMKAALHKRDPAFRIWDEADSQELDAGAGKGLGVLGPSAIVGDFDGDLLRDVALLGRSGADQVVIAILSDHGNIRAVEVAWRRVRPGKRENKSRGDPQAIPPIYLELAPRGSPNPFCWTRNWGAPPIDAIGIVEPSVARFDYVLERDRFV